MPTRSQVQPTRPASVFHIYIFSLSIYFNPHSHMVMLNLPVDWSATCSSHLGLACGCNVAGSRHLFLVALTGHIQCQHRFPKCGEVVQLFHLLNKCWICWGGMVASSTVSSCFHNLQDHVARGPLQIFPKIFAGIDRCLPNCYETWGDDHPSGLSGKAKASQLVGLRRKPTLWLQNEGYIPWYMLSVTDHDLDSNFLSHLLMSSSSAKFRHQQKIICKLSTNKS